MNEIATSLHTPLPTIGIIGLGEMGRPIARNLRNAGYQTYGFDLDAGRLDAAQMDGIVGCANVADLVLRCDIVGTSLPSSSAWVGVMEQEVLPKLRPAQTVIDFGTVTPPETVRIGALVAEKGAALVDSPVSGGGQGVEQATLYMFVGASDATFTRLRPVLEAIGGSERITHCGEVGAGQVVKGVNQLMMGLVDAAYLEAISFGVNCGVDIETIQSAIGSAGRWRADFSRIAQRIIDGRGNNVGVKYRELPYFIEAAFAENHDLPIARVVYGTCEKGKKVVVDDHRPAPSYWHELTSD